MLRDKLTIIGVKWEWEDPVWEKISYEQHKVN